MVVEQQLLVSAALVVGLGEIWGEELWRGQTGLFQEEEELLGQTVG